MGRGSDVIIYQMGKVASTAILRALRRLGLDAVQVHFLGEPSLIKILQMLLQHDASDHFLKHGSQQLLANIEVTRTLNWYSRHGPEKGVKLKIISLAREPVAWYWSNLVQNFEEYRDGILTWHQANWPDRHEPSDLRTILTELQCAVWALAEAVSSPLDTPEYLIELASLESSAFAHQDVLRTHLLNLRRPHVWFDQFIHPVLGIDIYDRGPQVLTDSGSSEPAASAIYANEFCELLVVRYEQLDEATSTIADFCDVAAENMEIKRENVTAAKPIAPDVKKAASEAVMSEQLADRIYSTKYCRHFVYRRQADAAKA